MNTKQPQFGKKWHRMVQGAAVMLAVAFLSSLGYASWEYTSWQNKWIEWDFGTLERLCGGDTEEDRLLDIEFVRQWDYKALKKTSDGREVWMHWKLSKRHCGNWMLIDRSQYALIKPIEVRFPNGVPHRNGVSCLGVAID